jgi:DNA-binding IclR family transcriptional regulator
MPRTGRPAARTVDSVRRAIAVLDALADAGGESSTTEVAARTGINISTISRLLGTLAAEGIVQYQAATGRYRLGVRLVQLASAARDTLDIRAIARPYLAELSVLTGETSTLSLPGLHELMTVDLAQGPRSVRSVAQIGRNSVAHATAAGKVFLAWGGALADGDLTAYTRRTITDRAVLAEEVDLVRGRGWAQAIGEREEDLNAVAVPVLDGHRQLVAVLGVQGPAGRFGPKTMRAALDPMRERAALVGAALWS